VSDILSSFCILGLLYWFFMLTFFGGWNPYSEKFYTGEEIENNHGENDKNLDTALELANVAMYLDMNGEQ